MSSAVQFFGIPLIQSFRLSTDGVTPKNLFGLNRNRMNGNEFCETSMSGNFASPVFRRKMFREIGSTSFAKPAKSVLQVLRNLLNFGETSPKQQVLAKLQNRYCFWQK